mgnify:CR=1 FL=1
MFLEKKEKKRKDSQKRGQQELSKKVLYGKFGMTKERNSDIKNDRT